mmetsp:Transcript_131572/g.293459  ORF Transcript_131572/g.293459 Transcript_131572/m.293459 type:complete len:235 (-) Transcript_131572:103-807(-)
MEVGGWQLGIAVRREPAVAQGLQWPGAMGAIPASHPIHEVLQPRHGVWEAVPRHREAPSGSPEVVTTIGGREHALHSSALARHMARQELEENHAQAEDVTTRVPQPGLPRLRRDVPRRATDTLSRNGEAQRKAEVDEYRSGRGVGVGTGDHDVGFFNVAVHGALFMQVAQTLQTLPQERSPPCLAHPHPAVISRLPELREVAAKVGFVYEVVERAVLEDLISFRDVIVMQVQHQ